MPRVVLTSSAVAYSLLTLLQAQNRNFPVSPRELNIQYPSAALEAANTGIVKFGTPNSNTAPTDVTSPDTTLAPDSFDHWEDKFGLPLSETFVKGSVDAQVLYVRGA